VSDKKLKHRQIDAKRKNRENVAYEKLQQLTSTVAKLFNNNNNKKQKAEILEDAVNTFSALHQQFQAVEQQIQTEQQYSLQNQLLWQQHHTTIVGELQKQLTNLTTPSPLASSFFLHSGLMLSSMNMRGRLLDANKVSSSFDLSNRI
jgi:hypothetical protein